MRKREKGGESMLVVYRACSTGSKKPRPVGGKNKLVKLCFESFKEAFGNVDYQLVVLLDKPNKAFRNIFRYENRIESYYPDFTTGNVGTFHKQISLVLENKDDFFFVEDDYYFLPSAGEKIMEAIKEFSFITPYDHPGYYTEDIHDYRRYVRLVGNHHWQTVISTTLTFGGKHKALKEEADTMKKYGWADHPMWTDITQRHTLWCPIPSLATHMETPFLAPSVDWPFLENPN